MVDFPELNLVVSGNAVLSRHSTDGGLRGINRRPRPALARGHGPRQRVDIPGRVQDLYAPSCRRKLPPAAQIYVALGDWHAFASYSQSTVTTFYSRAPGPTSLDASGSGYVASITLSDQGVAVEPVRVGRTETERLSVDVAGRSEREIIGLIGRRARPSLMLDVVLRGLAAVDRVT